MSARLFALRPRSGVRTLALLVALTASAGLAAPAGAAGSGAHGERARPSTATGASVPAPTVSGPIARTSPVGDPAHGYPFLATDVNLASAGYVEQEFFISGAATRYSATGTSTGTVLSTGHPYRTRIVVRRPISARRSTASFIAEWYNVSNQWDQEVDWFQTHEHLLREGYAWVGISAQPVGVHSATGLRAWSPSRYGTLDVTAGGTITDNSLSYDIFSQAVKAIRSPAGLDPLGSLREPQYVIATGHSQSGALLRSYVNSILPLSNILDAVVLHGIGGALRTDLARPVFRINSEGDVANALLGGAVRQPDSSILRTWEVAGASHGDWKLITDYGPLRKRDIGTYPGGYPGEPQTCDLPPLSRVPQHMVQNALYDHTVRWVAYGISPPTAPLITLTSTTPPVVARDSLGLALGGIRLAQHEVPLRINTGVNTGPGLLLPRRKLGSPDRRAARGALPDGAVIRRRGRRGHARERQGGLHPAFVHPRPRVVLRDPRDHQRSPRQRPDRGAHRDQAARPPRSRRTARPSRATSSPRSSTSSSSSAGRTWASGATPPRATPYFARRRRSSPSSGRRRTWSAAAAAVTEAARVRHRGGGAQWTPPRRPTIAQRPSACSAARRASAAVTARSAALTSGIRPGGHAQLAHAEPGEQRRRASGLAGQLAAHADPAAVRAGGLDDARR